MYFVGMGGLGGLDFRSCTRLKFLVFLGHCCVLDTQPTQSSLQAVVGGKYADKHVPAHLRHLLAAESGCNDGAAFPFLYLASTSLQRKATAMPYRTGFSLRGFVSARGFNFL